MSTNESMLFFYGLFMDESLLASKGIRPTESTVGYVDGYGLRIGKRATLLPEANSRAYGVLMKIASEDACRMEHIVSPAFIRTLRQFRKGLDDRGK